MRRRYLVKRYEQDSIRAIELVFVSGENANRFYFRFDNENKYYDTEIAYICDFKYFLSRQGFTLVGTIND